MAYLKFNKAELVNLEYSLKREIVLTNMAGGYANSTIVGCNTRKYHGLLVVPIEAFGGEKHILLSALDETLLQHGKPFNLGIHNYGSVYEPRGHKYIVDFQAEPNIKITYQVGGMVLVKEFVMVSKKDQVLIKYTLEDAHYDTTLRLKPYLAFRNTHALTYANTTASTHYTPVENGAAFKMYEGFPTLHLQLSKGCEYVHNPDWYRGVVYMEEYRRGFDCKEDLFVPGFFELPLKKGESVIFSASIEEADTNSLKRLFTREVAAKPPRDNYDDCLRASAKQLITIRSGRSQICSGYSWMATGVLRDTCIHLPGLTIFNDGNIKLFKQILDDLIGSHQEELLCRSLEVEAPLRLTEVMQHYGQFTSSYKKIWKEYGELLKSIIRSYISGREEVQLHQNGLLWARKNGVALSWMNAYLGGVPVTERSGYQVETNCLWYNALCFAIDMEHLFGKDFEFIERLSAIKSAIEANFYNMFWVEERGHLADYIDEQGQNKFTRPNQLYACSLQYSPVAEVVQAEILKAVKRELLTTKGIRTLSPKNPLYKGVYEGNQNQRDLAYHNGSARPWLLGAYISANFKLHGGSFVKKAQELIGSFEEDMNVHGIGSIAEIYDGDPPHHSHGAINSAVSIAEILRCKYLINKYKEE